MDDETSRSPHGERGLKYGPMTNCVRLSWSLSSRRAWIEMVQMVKCVETAEVALLTESVD